MKRWEYKVEEGYLSELTWSSLGEEGWELVGVAATMSSSKYIFKREITDPNRSPSREYVQKLMSQGKSAS